MEILYEKSFLNDINKIKNKIIKKKLLETIDILKSKENISQLKIVKIKGYSSYYRMKLSDYRIGLKYKDKKIILIRFLHRKDIYRYFPIQ